MWEALTNSNIAMPKNNMFRRGGLYLYPVYRYGKMCTCDCQIHDLGHSHYFFNDDPEIHHIPAHETVGVGVYFVTLQQLTELREKNKVLTVSDDILKKSEGDLYKIDNFEIVYATQSFFNLLKIKESKVSNFVADMKHIFENSDRAMPKNHTFEKSKKNKHAIYRYGKVCKCDCRLVGFNLYISDETGEECQEHDLSLYGHTEYRMRTYYVSDDVLAYLIGNGALHRINGNDLRKIEKFRCLEQGAKYATWSFINKYQSLMMLNGITREYEARKENWYLWHHFGLDGWYPYKMPLKMGSYHDSNMKRGYMWFNGYSYDIFEQDYELLSKINREFEKLYRANYELLNQTSKKRYDSYKPIFHKMETGKPILLVGMEVESVDTNHLLIEPIKNGLKPLDAYERYKKYKIITENDSSTPEKGGEIILNCALSNQFKTYIKTYKKMIWGPEENRGLRGDERKCGGHINISVMRYKSNYKELVFLSSYDVLKLMGAKNLAAILSLYQATRKENNYCRYKIDKEKRSAIRTTGKDRVLTEFRVFPICHNLTEALQRIELIELLLEERDFEKVYEYIESMDDFKQHCFNFDFDNKTREERKEEFFEMVERNQEIILDTFQDCFLEVFEWE